MSTRSTRIGALVGLAALLTVTIAAGQHRAAVGTDPEGQGVAVFNPIEGRIRVLSSRPEGARVEKGEVICELDPAELRDRVASQEIAVQGLRAGVEGARFAREAAAMDLDEYKDGGFARDSAAAQAAVRLAESDLRRHEDKLDWTHRMYNKGYASKAELVAEQLVFDRAKYALELAESGRQALVRTTRPKTTRALMGAVETARERELGKEAELRRAESILKSLHDQIGWCKVAAPVAGRVRYDAPIGPGAVVRDGQVLFRVVPDTAPAGAAK
jgi:multidrug efflux pump subunit AcrA (membrane-fusion protein)